MNKNVKGFTAVEAIIMLVVVGIIGGAATYVWQTSNKKDDTTQINKQTVEKPQQVSPKEVKVAQDYREIKEWSVKVPVASVSSDRFSYTLGDKGESQEQIASLIDNEILRVEGASRPCAAQILLARSTDGLFYNAATDKREKLSDGIRGAYTKMLGNYYYRIILGQGCGYDEELNKKIDALYETGFSAFKTDLTNLELTQ